MAIGFAGALGRGALQAARGLVRARPSSTLSALRAGEAELLQSGIGSRAGLTPLPRPRPPSQVPWTPATQASDLLGGSPEATALFQRTRLELGLAESAGDPEIFRRVVDRVVREGRLSRMSTQEVSVLEDSITQIADKLGVRAYNFGEEAIQAMPGKAGTTAFRSVGNRNSVENALRSVQNERQLSDIYEFALRNVDLEDKAQRTWFNNLLIKIEQQSDELIKQNLLRELRTSPEALTKQAFPDETLAQMARILKIKPEDLRVQLTDPEELVNLFYNSRAARSFGSAALPPKNAVFDSSRYINAIRSAFKPGEIRSIKEELNDRFVKGILTADQASALRPIFKLQEEAIAKGRFNRMIDYFEREGKDIGQSLRSDIRMILVNGDDGVRQAREQLRVRKGRGPRRPWSEEGMPMEEGKGPTGFSWGGKEGDKTLQQWLTESLGEQADERSRRAAQEVLRRNLPDNDPYIRTKPMRFKNGQWEEVPLDEYRRMGPEAREALKYERVPITHTEAGLEKPYKISRVKLDVGDRSPEALAAKQKWIDDYGYQRLLELKEARNLAELKAIWTRIEVAKYQDVMDEGFFNILLNEYKEKALTLRNARRRTLRGRYSRPEIERGAIDRPTVEDLYRDSFTNMEEMLNYEGLVRAARDAGTATVRT